MRVFLYSLRRFSDGDQPLAPAEQWVRRRRKAVAATIVDFSPKQRRRDRLISSAKRGDVIVCPSIHNFSSSIADLIRIIPKVEAKGLTVILVKERLELRAGSIRMKMLKAFCELVLRHGLNQKREDRIRASYLARILGTPIGRPEMSSDRRREIIRLLQEERLSLAEAAKRVGISKSSAFRISKGRR